jgi:nitroreductase
MVRRYRPDPVPVALLEAVLAAALRGPSAGFSQGFGFLALDRPADVAAFRAAATPAEDAGNWFCANFEAPAVVLALSNKTAYLDRYAQPDKGRTDRSDAWWTAPYWDIDTGFGVLLMLLTAVDKGLGACFFGVPIETVPEIRAAFGIPDEMHPIGAVTLGYPDEPPRDLTSHRRAASEMVRWVRWSDQAQAEPPAPAAPAGSGSAPEAQAPREASQASTS